MSIPADLSKYTHTHEVSVANHTHDVSLEPHSHSLGVRFKDVEPMSVYIVEFLFEDEDLTEIVRLGVFSQEEEARHKAFNFSEEHIEDDSMVALYISKVELDEEFAEELIVEHYFN